MKTLRFLILFFLISRAVFAAEEQVPCAYDLACSVNRTEGTITFTSFIDEGRILRSFWVQIQPSGKLVLVSFQLKEKGKEGNGASLFVKMFVSRGGGVPSVRGTLTRWEKDGGSTASVAMAPQAMLLLNAVGLILLEEYAVPLLGGAEELATSERSQAILYYFFATAIEELLAKKAAAPQKILLLRKEEAA